MAPWPLLVRCGIFLTFNYGLLVWIISIWQICCWVCCSDLKLGVKLNMFLSWSSVSAMTCISCWVSDLNCSSFSAELLLCLVVFLSVGAPTPCQPLSSCYSPSLACISLVCSLTFFPLSHSLVQSMRYLINTLPCCRIFKLLCFLSASILPERGFCALANVLLSKFAEFQLITLTLILMYLYFIHLKSCFFPLSI